MHGARSANACHRHRHTRQGGFSLIEILIAMTVTLIGLAGLLSLHLTTVQGNSRATRTVMGSVIAQRTMEGLRSMPVQAPVTVPPYLEPTLASPPFSIAPGCPAAAIPMATVLGPDNTSYRPLVSVCALGPAGSPLENLVLVRVVIEWSDQGAAASAADSRLHHQMVLESVRTRQDVL
jgi:prepilin-type N-terminal cleavage/methylation domain-containing protein